MDHTSAAQLAATIGRWLLESEAQIRTGPEWGGVAGTLDAHGRPEFLYPEAAGYYLSWLAFLQELGHSKPLLESRARPAAAWVSRSIDRGDLRTRRYLIQNGHDWRNQAVFAFDLAMVWRGMVAAHDLLDRRWQGPLVRLPEELQRFIAGGGLLAYRPVAEGSSTLPQRWSTQPGPYQLKIALPLLAMPGSSVPEPLRLTATCVYRYWRNRLATNAPADEPHALFYALEGLLHAAACGYDPDAWNLAARIYTALLRERQLATWLDPAGSARSDVVGQALRLGAALLASGQLRGPAVRKQLDQLAQRLAMYVSAGGAVWFTTGPQHPFLSTWSAMFAHQALCYFAAAIRGEPLPRRWIELLV